ncbi:T9SS type A sorting domain-containing protein [bacterium SCSIO 12741]|nr:T9SS type A sorting domain-containing protein [bacterium SCSIO 12741]
MHLKFSVPLMLAFLVGPHLYGQNHVIPDGRGESASSQLFFTENKGQLVDLNYDPRPEVKFYHESSTIELFLLENSRVVFGFNYLSSYPGIPDSISRLDMTHMVDEEILTPSTSSPIAVEQLLREDNYFLAHCQPGIQGVKSYQRVVYPNVYPHIDHHVYSNAAGFKFYWVIQPGGDPNEIRIQFDGQDQLLVDSVEVEIFQDQIQIALEQAIAYEIDANNQVTPTSWQPYYRHYPDSTLGFYTDSYDTTKTLVIQVAPPAPPLPSSPMGSIRNLEWSTYIGEKKQDGVNDLFHDKRGYTYLIGTTQSSKFPLVANKTAHVGETDAFIVEFTDQGRNYKGTFYGGKKDDAFTCGEALPNGDILIAGNTMSHVVNGKTNPDKTPQDQTSSGIVTKWDNDLSQILFEDFYGGSAQLEIADLSYQGNQEFVIVGNTYTPVGTNSRLTFVNRGGNSFHQRLSFVQEGFISRLSTIQGAVIHNTQYGGGSKDAVTAVQSDGLGNYYIAGYTETRKTETVSCSPSNDTHYPPIELCQSLGDSIFRDTNTGPGSDLFVCMFNSLDELKWATLIGSEKSELENAHLAIDPDQPSMVYLGGMTEGPSSFPIPNQAPGFQWTPNTSGVMQGFVIRINDRKSIDWGTLIGCDSSLSLVTDIKMADNLGILVTGGTLCNDPQSPQNYGSPPTANQFPMADNGGQLWLQRDSGQVASKGSWESFIQVYNASHQLQWSTFYGGNDADQYQRISYEPINQKIYTSGSSNIDKTAIPLLRLQNTNSFFDTLSPHLGNLTTYIARFDGMINAMRVSENLIEDQSLKIWPNPTRDILNVELQEDSEVFILNLQGQIVEHQSFATGGDQTLSLKKLVPGSYCLLLRNKDFTKTAKVIVQ